MAESGLRAVCGVISAGLALGVAELVSVPVGADSTPLAAVGSAVVDHTPDSLREWMIQLVGTSDKLVLFVLMLGVSAIVAAVAGRVESLRRPAGSAVMVLFGVVAVAAAITRTGASWTSAVPTVVGVAAGITMLRWSIGRIETVPARPPERPAVTIIHDYPVATEVREEAPVVEVDRRRLMRGLATAGAFAVVAEAAGRVFGARVHNVSGERASTQLPVPSSPLPPIDPAADVPVSGAVSYVTPSKDFYRIDTALVVPELSVDQWSLRIHGMVDREISIDWASLANRPAIERLVTLTCVSNPVGGPLVGNAKWLGYRVRDLLAQAGPHRDADMVLSRSSDGFTAGSPLSVLTDGRDAMLAIGMNGEPLPVEHGYPARLVVPGLYGYVSATKWVTELEVTRFDKARAYWTTRGWSPLGPIKTATRIDVPRSGSKLPSGPVVVAGVAWAQHRGISDVEVQIDNGPWQPARTAAQPSIDSWRLWTFQWDAPAGRHTIQARATDGTAATQTSDREGVLPDGATGYPSITVVIT